MNAYDLLEVNDLIEKEGAETSSTDSIIKKRTQEKLTSAIRSLNGILKQEGTTTEILKKIEEKLAEATQYAIACEIIATSKFRKSYELKGRPDISVYTEAMDKKLRNATELYINGRTTNPYQILMIGDEDRTGRTPEEQNNNVRRRTLETVKLAISKTSLPDIDSMESLLLDLNKIMWAYNNIDTPEHRKKYNYKELARKGDDAAKAIGEVRTGKIKDKKIATIDFFDEREEYTKITISQVEILLSEEFLLEEEYGHGYIVNKYRKDGTTVESNIFSEIDMNRIGTDPTYSENVKELLSDESIALSQKYLGGYVGELDENRKRVFDLDKIGASRKWKMIREHQKKRINHVRPGTRRTEENPDPDDRRV